MSYKYRLLGTGVTNAQGIATLNKDPLNNTITGYTGVGAGKVDIVACDQSDPTLTGALLSPVKEILDCLKYDAGTSENHNDSIWSSSSNFTRGDSYTTVSSNGTAYGVDVGITDNVCIEIDMRTTVPSGTSFLFTLRDASNNNLFSANKNQTGFVNDEWQHFKISIIEGNVICINETSNTTLTGTASGVNKFTLRVQADYNCYFKELKIYPI